MSRKFKFLTLGILPTMFVATTQVSVAYNVSNENELNNKNAETKCLKDINEITKTENEILFSKLLIANKENNCLLVCYKNGGYSIISLTNMEILEVVPFTKKFHNLQNENRKFLYKGLGTISLFNSEQINPTSNFSNGVFVKQVDYNKINSSISLIKKEMREQEKLSTTRKFVDPDDLPSDWISVPAHERNFVSVDYEVAFSHWFKSATIRNSFSYADGETFRYDGPDWEGPIYANEKNKDKKISGICGYIAVGMLIFYNELFHSSGYFDDAEISKYVLPTKELENQSAWNMWRENAHSLFPKLIPLFSKHSYQKTFFNEGINRWWHAKLISDTFLNSKKNEGKINYSYAGNYWLFDNIAKTIMVDRIPTLLCGLYGEGGEDKGHCIVAYGMDKKGRFLCHQGWPNKNSEYEKPEVDYNYSQTIINSIFFKNGFNFTIYNHSANPLRKLFNFKGTMVDSSYMENKVFARWNTFW